MCQRRLFETKPQRMPSGNSAGLILLIVLYYASSTLNSCLTKEILISYPRPLTVTVAQQLLSSVGGVWQLWVKAGEIGALSRHWSAVLPVSATLVVSLASYRISLLYNAVSFAQVVKGLNPLFALLVSASLLRERCGTGRVLSLVLLVGGVGVATATELNFAPIGFGLALLSSFTQSVQAVLSKALLVRGTLQRDELFAVSAVLALLLLLPGWLAVDGDHLLRGEAPSVSVLLLLLLNGVCNFVTQLLSFTVLCTLTSPVSAAIVSTVKRVVIVVIAALWFGTRVTPLHALGIGTAIAGVGLYQVSSDEAKSKAPEAKLHGIKVDAPTTPRARTPTPAPGRRSLTGSGAAHVGSCGGACEDGWPRHELTHV